MRRYVLRRIAGAIPLILGIATLVFFLVRLAPGDPVLIYTAPGMDQEVVEQIRENMGLDQPLPVQYVRWLGSTMRGDLGESFQRNRSVRDVIDETLPNTLILSGSALLIAFLIGVIGIPTYI